MYKIANPADRGRLNLRLQRRVRKAVKSEQEKTVPEMKAEEFEQLLRAQATPIDFDHLIRTDIIEKHGARYKILKMSELPSCVLNQAKEAKQDKDGKTLLKFPASNKRAKKLLRDFEARKRS